MAKIRHLFPGGNTPEGFFSYYNYIISPEARRIFVLKGGPGTGKSTFMRKIGEALVAKGYDAEFHHCSSDNNSLDGVVIPQLKIAFIDGTAPHIVDPKHPGCVDEILNLGAYWNEAGITAHKAEIIACTTEISQNYQRAYRFLKAAKLIYDDLAAVYTLALDCAKANQAADKMLASIFTEPKQQGAGQIRKLFASAITPDGPINYLETSVWPTEKCFVIKGEPGTGKSTLLQKVINAAVTSGFYTEVFYCPLEPTKPEHVVIPALNIAVTTSQLPHVYKQSPALAVDMGDYLNYDIIEKYQDNIAYNQQMFWELWSKTIECLSYSKKLHDQLETYYVPYMNFAGVQTLWQDIYARVLAYSE